MPSIDEMEINTRVGAPEITLQAPAGSWFSKMIAMTGIDLILLFFMALLLSILVRSLESEIRWLHPSMGLPLAIMGSVLLIDFAKSCYFRYVKKMGQARRFLHQIPIIFRDWAPFVLIDFIYENLHDLSGKLRSFDIAPLLYRFDLFIFGFEPTLVTQKITTPWLTDLMAILYAPYLAFPLILMGLLTLGGRRKEFQQLSLAVMFTFLLGFICYAVFPALPPRFFITQLFTDPVSLRGSYIHDHLQNVWDQLSVVHGAAFPSLHVALSSIALIFAYRFRNISKIYRILFYVYIPLVPGLWFSTIYLRHHWFADLLAAWGVCALALYLSKRLNRINWKLKARFDIPL